MHRRARRIGLSGLALRAAAVAAIGLLGCASGSAPAETPAPTSTGSENTGGPVSSAPDDLGAPPPPTASKSQAREHLEAAVEGAVVGAMIGAQMGPIGAAAGAGTLMVYGAITGNPPVSHGGGGGQRTEGDREDPIEDEIDDELKQQASLEGEIEAELRRQEELLRKIEASDPASPTTPAPSADPTEDADSEPIERDEVSSTNIATTAPMTTDPREAPAAPAVRDLPTELFDSKKTTIPEGRWGNDDELEVTARSIDADRDGKPEEVRYFGDDGRLLRVELDRNYDGTIDAWITFSAGVAVARELDESGDGTPDAFEQYAGGRMTRREVDRDANGGRDAFYRFESGSLVEETHDADGDGRIDLTIVYENRARVRTEEDQNRDGKPDVWTHYAHETGGSEYVTRIERDKGADGKPDSFETFTQQDGKTVLSRREEDANGDGTIDITSVYENGKLKSREVADPSLVPL